MTYQEVIERADREKPNAFTTQEKMAWVASLEGKLAANVFLMDIEEIRALQHRHPDDLEDELMVTWPHDDIYVFWLEAMIDRANGEDDKYANSMQLYNAAYSDFVAWFVRTYEPAQGYLMGRGRG